MLSKTGSYFESLYGANFNILVSYLKEKKYISELDFPGEKLAGGSFWELMINKALAAIGPSLDPGAKPQDPLYTARYYEYSVNATKTSYRLRATMENTNYAGLASSKKGAFGAYATGCNNDATNGYYCLGTAIFP